MNYSIHYIEYSLHLALNLIQQLGQLSLIRWLGRPSNSQSLLHIRLGDQMEMYMVYLLMRNATIVL